MSQHQLLVINSQTQVTFSPQTYTLNHPAVLLLDVFSLHHSFLPPPLCSFCDIYQTMTNQAPDNTTTKEVAFVCVVAETLLIPNCVYINVSILEIILCGL